jgi:hypothetical protein
MRLVIRFRTQGMQWPLRDGDEVELWTDHGELRGTYRADMLLRIVELYDGLVADAAVRLEARVTAERPLRPGRVTRMRTMLLSRLADEVLEAGVLKRKAPAPRRPLVGAAGRKLRGLVYGTARGR